MSITHTGTSSIISHGGNEDIGIDAQSFIDFIDSQHLANMGKMLSFVTRIMHNPSLIPIGSDRHFVYRLLVRPTYLRSDDNNCSLEALDTPHQRLLPHFLLGLNQPPVANGKGHNPTSTKATHPNSCPSSTRSIHSEDDDLSGFVFFQLGEIQYANHYREDDWSSTTAEDLTHAVDGEDTEGLYDWEYTGYNLVARLGTKNGRVDGIYAVYNMFPFHPFKQRIEKVQLVDAHWNLFPCGHPDPGHDVKLFAAARIADNLGDLGYATVLTWEDQMERAQLVRVRQTDTIVGAVRLSVYQV